MNKSAKTAMSLVGSNNDGGRPADDFYPTPPEVTRALLKVEPFSPMEMIWECAAGDGSMSKVLQETGCQVFSSELNDRGYGIHGVDFLESDLRLPKSAGFNISYPVIVTNPPFKLASEFIRHAIYDLNVDKLCLLMKLSALEGSSRSKLLRDTGLSRVWVFSNRIQLTRNGEEKRGSGMIAFAWFVWEKGWEGKPQIGWISTKD